MTDGMKLLADQAASVLVTGATGGLGRNAVEMLRAQGVRVRATGRDAQAGAALRALGADFVRADLVYLSDAQADLLLEGVDTVWHCAALSSPWGPPATFHAANVQATQRIADAALRAKARCFVHVSTPSIYFDYRHHHDLPESYRARRYVNDYARTKALAEDLIRARAAAHPGTRFVILRPRALFGPHDRVLLPRMLALQRQRRGALLLPRGGDALMDLSYTPNVVQAMLAASTRAGLPSGQAYNITNQEPRRLGQVLTQLLHDELGLPLRIRRIPYRLADLLSRGSEVWAKLDGQEPRLTRYGMAVLHYDMTLSNARAIGELGYRPRHGMDEAIALTAAWLRGNGA